MFEKLAELNIEFDKNKEELFIQYISLFSEYNYKVNLISNNDVKQLFEKHIYDSLSLNLFLKKYSCNKNIKLLDIGTGGGFPSVPLALNYPEMNVSAVDSINKKINFLKMVSDKLNIKNINPMCIRIENLKEEYINKYDIVTTRALAELRIILEYAIPFVKVGGYFIAYKSLKAEEELENAQNAMKVLNVDLIDKIEYTLPIETENRRVLLIFKKTKQTSSIYPRKNGIIKKQPL